MIVNLVAAIVRYDAIYIGVNGEWITVQHKRQPRAKRNFSIFQTIFKPNSLHRIAYLFGILFGNFQTINSLSTVVVPRIMKHFHNTCVMDFDVLANMKSTRSARAAHYKCTLCGACKIMREDESIKRTTTMQTK